MPKPTADDVKKYRDEKQVGMYEAKAHLMKEHVIEELAAIKRTAGNDPGRAVVRLCNVLIETLNLD